MATNDPARPWAAGAVISGRYRLVSPLGHGAMGEIWRAQHISLATQVAIKLIDLAASREAEMVRARFLEEARAAAQLRSAHVVRILDHGAEGRIAFIAMELLEGETLADRLDRVGRLEPRELALIFAELALALGQAHEAGIVHRDLKPANIFLARADGREIAKILDFGIAKRTADVAPKTRIGIVVGTPAYMSPEQAMGEPLDWRCDLWQLGAIAYECLVGTVPFQASTIGGVFMAICSAPLPVPSASATVPDGFDAWFSRALARPREERFQSARELAAALGAVLAPGLAMPAGVTVNPLDSGTFAARAARIAEIETMHETGAGARTGTRTRTLVVGAALAFLVGAVVVYVAMPSPAAPRAAAPPASASAVAPSASASIAPPSAEPSQAVSAAPPAPSASASAAPPAAPRGGGPRRRRPEDELGI
jgi:serine/threonine-protein kinase